MSIPRYLLIALSKTHCFFSHMAVWTFFNRQVLSSPRPPNRQVPVPKRDTGTESDGTHKLGWEGWQLDSDGKKGRDSMDGQHSGLMFVFFCLDLRLSLAILDCWDGWFPWTSLRSPPLDAGKGAGSNAKTAKKVKAKIPGTKKNGYTSKN